MPFQEEIAFPFREGNFYFIGTKKNLFQIND